jgi:hypothetical protein
MTDYKIGKILDFTRDGDDSPYIGIVVFDDDLKEKVIYEQNGSFTYMKELDKKNYTAVDDLDSFLEEVKAKYPDEYAFTCKFINDTSLFTNQLNPHEGE